MQVANSHAQLVLNNAGQLVALAMGSHPFEPAVRRPAGLVAKLCAMPTTKEAILQKLHAGINVEDFPNLLEEARLTLNLPEMGFSVAGYADPVKALLWFGDFDLARFGGQLEFPSAAAPGADENLAAAWNDEGFAVWVRGEKYVKALQEFHQAILDRKVVFADWFFTPDGFAGPVLANETLVSERDRMVIRTLQRHSEEILARELNASSRFEFGTQPGQIAVAA